MSRRSGTQGSPGRPGGGGGGGKPSPGAGKPGPGAGTGTDAPATRQLGLAPAAALGATSAVLFFLAFHPVSFLPAAYVCLIPWLVVVDRAAPRRAIAASGLIHMAQGLATNYWLAFTSLAPGELRMTLGPDTWVGTGAGYLLYGFAYGGFVKAMLSWRRIPAVLWFPASIVALEYIQGNLFFSAYPWTWLGQSQVPWLAIVQTADIGGATTVSFMVAAVNAAIFEAIAFARGSRGDLARRDIIRALAWRAAFAGILFAGTLAYGLWRLGSIPKIEGPTILVVQGAIPQERKNEGGRSVDLLEEYKRLTYRALGRPIDLILWPETMLPMDIADVPGHGRQWVAIDRHRGLQREMATIARTMKAPIITGSGHLDWDADGVEKHHNSAFYIGRDGRILGRYDKIYLAPVSEYAPFEKSWPWLHAQIRSLVPPGFNQFEPGARVEVFDLETPGRTWRFAISICFDIVFARHGLDLARNGAELHVNVSNYGWFKDSAELDLALDHSILRAIETRRGIAACANGGISAFIDATGRAEPLVVDGRMKEVEGLLLGRVETSDAVSPYVRLGDTWAYANIGVSAALLAGAGHAARRRRRVKTGEEVKA